MPVRRRMSRRSVSRRGSGLSGGYMANPSIRGLGRKRKSVRRRGGFSLKSLVNALPKAVRVGQAGYNAGKAGYDLYKAFKGSARAPVRRRKTRRGGFSLKGLVNALPKALQVGQAGYDLYKAVKGNGRRRRVGRPRGSGLSGGVCRGNTGYHLMGSKRRRATRSRGGMSKSQIEDEVRHQLKRASRRGASMSGGIGFNPLGALIGATRGLFGVGRRRSVRSRRGGMGARVARRGGANNPWIAHVKVVQRQTGLPYGLAMREARKSY